MTPLAVVVPTRDRAALLSGCLEALRRELREDDELVVVDSCSQRPVHGALRADRPGASLARNLGWRATSAPVVAFVDDDVRVAAGWRAALDEALHGVAFVCGRVTVPPGQEGVERPVAVTPDVPRQPLGDLRGVSANLAVRRSALEAVGGFDERLGPGTWSRAGEDLELQDRLLRSGHAGLYAPEVLAFHEQWRSRGELVRLDYGYGIGAGARAAWRGGAQGRAVLREALWDNGLRPMASDLRKGYQLGVVCGLVRAAGAVVGFVRGRRRR